MWRSFLIAGRFFTRLPLPEPGPVSDSDLGRCAVFFPLVGLVIGLMVWGVSELTVGFGVFDLNRATSGGHSPPYGLAAALALVAWVWLTGGLHLDGLADTADAWIGGLGDRRRTLEIMQDPGSGPFGVMALVLVLLCKWTALSALMTADATVNLIWIPVLARAQLLILFLTTSAARPEGMGAAVRTHLPRTAAWTWLVVALAASALFLGWEWLGLVVAAGLLFLPARRSMLARLGGFSGDTAGALVELSEALMLVVAVFFGRLYTSLPKSTILSLS